MDGGNIAIIGTKVYDLFHSVYLIPVILGIYAVRVVDAQSLCLRWSTLCLV